MIDDAIIVIIQDKKDVNLGKIALDQDVFLESMHMAFVFYSGTVFFLSQLTFDFKNNFSRLSSVFTKARCMGRASGAGAGTRT